ncbi:MAG: hypothetical protein J6X55_11475 [Victivallales bacterium]|nr:hypothetical protein [Victivallales bacterium]
MESSVMTKAMTFRGTWAYHRLLPMLVWIMILGSGSMADECIERGIDYLSREYESSKYYGLEVLRMFKTQKMYNMGGEYEKRLQALYKKTPRSEGIINALAHIMMYGYHDNKAARSGFEDANGCWAAEEGGVSEIRVTLLVLQFLYEFEWSKPETTDGIFTLSFIVDTLLQQGVSMKLDSRFLWKMLVEFSILECLAHFYWRDFSENMYDGFMEQWGMSMHDLLEKIYEVRPKDFCLYDMAMVVRYYCMIGESNVVDEFVAILKERQLPDGHWKDNEKISVIFTTCSVLDALMAYDEATNAKINLDAFLDGVDESLSVVVTSDTASNDYRFSICLFEKESEVIVEKWGKVADGEPIRRDIAFLEPGEYVLDACVFSERGKALVARKKLDIEIPSWHSMAGISSLELLGNQMLYAGDEVRIEPVVRVDYIGNESIPAKISWKMMASDGKIIVEETAQDALLCGNVKTLLESDEEVANDDEVENDVEEDESLGLYQFKDTVLSAGGGIVYDAGIYEVRVSLDCEGETYVSSAFITVKETSDLLVESGMVPPVLTTEASIGAVKTTIRLQKSDGYSSLASFGGTSYRILEKKNGHSGIYEVAINEIRNQAGTIIKDGWLAVKVDYGKVTNGEPLEDGLPDGSCTAHHIVDGNVMIEYSGVDDGVRGTVPMRVYSCINHNGISKCNEELGIIELLLQ